MAVLSALYICKCGCNSAYSFPAYPTQQITSEHVYYGLTQSAMEISDGKASEGNKNS